MENTDVRNFMNQPRIVMTLLLVTALTSCTPPLQRISESNECVNCDLSELDFSSLGSLTGTNLSGATIEDVKISDFQFVGVNLAGAHITSSTFQRVSFENSNLSGAIVSDVTFVDSQISKSDLSEASIKTRSDGVFYLGDTEVSSAKLEISGDELFMEAINFSDVLEVSVSTDSLQLIGVEGGASTIFAKSKRLTIDGSREIRLTSLEPQLDHLQVTRASNVAIHNGAHDFEGIKSGIEILNVDSVKQLIVKNVGPGVLDLSVTENLILKDWSLETFLSESVLDKYLVEDGIVKRRFNEYGLKSSDWRETIRSAYDKRASFFPQVMRDGFYPRFGAQGGTVDLEVKEAGLFKWKRVLKNLNLLERKNYSTMKAAWDSINKGDVILSADAKRWMEIFRAGNVDKYLYEGKKAAFYSSNLQTCKAPTIPRTVAPADVLYSTATKVHTTELFFRIPEIDSSVNAFMDCMNDGWKVFDSEMATRDKGFQELADVLNGREQLAESLRAERQDRIDAELEAERQAVWRAIGSTYDIKDIVTTEFLSIYMGYKMTEDPLGQINFLNMGGWNSSEGSRKRLSIEKNIQTEINRCIFRRSGPNAHQAPKLALLTTFSTVNQRGGKPTLEDAQAIQMPLAELEESMAEFMGHASTCVSSAIMKISTY